MKLLILTAILSLSALAQMPAEEPVPGLILPEELELPQGKIILGSLHDEAVAALGSGWKFKDKPKRYTGAKLASQADLVEQFAPMYPRMVELARKAAVDCGQECWMELLEVKIGKQDAVRLSLMGPSKEKMSVYMIVLDQGGMAMRAWRREMLKDLRQDTNYFVTDNGTYRIRRLGRVYKLEHIQ